jgi:hypothetical protein
MNYILLFICNKNVVEVVDDMCFTYNIHVYDIVFVETYFVLITFVGGCHLKKPIRKIYNIGREKFLV